MYSQVKSRNLNFFELSIISLKAFFNRIIDIFILVILINIPIRIAYLFISSFIIDTREHFFISLLMTILEGFILLIPTISVILIISNEINGYKFKLSKIFSKSISLWKGAVITNVIEGIITFLLFILLIIPGIVWSVYYIFSMQAVTFENLRGKEALDYSKSLVKGQWWKVFLIFLPYAIIYFAIFWFLKTPNAFGEVNTLSIIVIPIRELVNVFLVVVTSILYINIQHTNTQTIEKLSMPEFVISKIGVEIDDREVDFDYQPEYSELVCQNCGASLVEFYEICPECGKDTVNKDLIE